MSSAIPESTNRISSFCRSLFQQSTVAEPVLHPTSAPCESMGWDAKQCRARSELLQLSTQWRVYWKTQTITPLPLHERPPETRSADAGSLPGPREISRDFTGWPGAL